MEKILFASDLDGTLLNDRAIVAPEYAEMLNGLIDRGCLFTIATARGPAGARHAIEPSGIRLALPAVCLNGALIWDMNEPRAVRWFPIEKSAAKAAAELFMHSEAFVRMFVVGDNGATMSSYYRDDVAIDEAMTRYLRVTAQPHLPVRPFSEFDGSGDVIEFSCHEHHTKLDGIYEKLIQLDGLKVVYYADTYRDGYKFLECGAANGGKGKGTKAAQAIAGADKLYVFGDNFNDRPMYEIADKSFAPNTAEPDMQAIATHVIPSHNEGGVIRTIRDIFEGRF